MTRAATEGQTADGPGGRGKGPKGSPAPQSTPMQPLDDAGRKLLESRYGTVRERIAAAAKRAGRSERDVILVAVTKNAEPEQIRALVEMGHRDFGENRVQQLQQRAAWVAEIFTRQKIHPNTRRIDPSPGLFFTQSEVELKPTQDTPAGPRGCAGT